MTVSLKFTATIFDCLPHAVFWLRTKRDTERDNLDERIRAGLNFSIVVNSACFLEGALESGLTSLVSHRLLSDKSTDPFKIRLVDDLQSRIRTATGTGTYDNLFALIVGSPASSMGTVTPLWEGIVSLFHLRNVLAHGRALNFAMEFPNDEFPPDWDAPSTEEFRGGYKKVQDYLLKKKVIAKTFTDQSWEMFFLVDEIADHFFCLSVEFIVAIANSLKEEDQHAFKSATSYDALMKIKVNGPKEL